MGVVLLSIHPSIVFPATHHPICFTWCPLLLYKLSSVYTTLQACEYSLYFLATSSCLIFYFEFCLVFLTCVYLDRASASPLPCAFGPSQPGSNPSDNLGQPCMSGPVTYTRFLRPPLTLQTSVPLLLWVLCLFLNLTTLLPSVPKTITLTNNYNAKHFPFLNENIISCHHLYFCGNAKKVTKMSFLESKRIRVSVVETTVWS